MGKLNSTLIWLNTDSPNKKDTFLFSLALIENKRKKFNKVSQLRMTHLSLGENIATRKMKNNSATELQNTRKSKFCLLLFLLICKELLIANERKCLTIWNK